ncbi:unnamed protein product [Rotaria sordida]|uniref:Uncharacterized protein n=1 Tax=Rotaria sordida TaxID=392033 RepID=A0A815GWD4_9BILA|nr:unnamed protein product [Rotaria sordida]CAF3938814.1 unnamed protein product [Rotaria sordida]
MLLIPSPTGVANPPAPLDFNDFAEIFDELLPEPTRGQKRKLRQRREDPPTPSLQRQSPPIIPRRTVPSRDATALLLRGSLHSSSILNDK